MKFYSLFTAQGPGGGWGGANSWSSASSSGQPGQPGRSEVSYSYGGIDANGVPYGGSSGNGGFHINVSDGQGRTQTYSGGQPGQYPGQPGYPHGQPDFPTGQPGFPPGHPGTFSYSNADNRYNQGPGQGGYRNSSASSWSSASAWSTFYVIALFSFFVMLKL